MRAADLLNNAHLNTLATVLRVSVASTDWQQQYPDGTFWHAWERVQKAVKGGWDNSQIEDMLCDVSEVFTGIVECDVACSLHTPEDLAWLYGAIQTGDSLALHMMILKAFLVPVDEHLTPAEVAEATGTAESGWRNKANAGAIPGAVKKGKQWLLPRSVLRLQGVFD